MLERRKWADIRRSEKIAFGWPIYGPSWFISIITNKIHNQMNEQRIKRRFSEYHEAVKKYKKNSNI